MKRAFIAILLLAASGVQALPTFASAEPYDVKGMDAFCDHQEVVLVKAHMVNEDGSYKHGHRSKVRFIDGNQPAIEIAGIDNGYITIPQKSREVYYGK